MSTGLYALAALIIGVACVLIFFAFKASNVGAPAGYSTSMVVQKANKERDRECFRGTRPVVHLEVTSHDAQSATMTLNAELCMPEEALVNLHDPSGKPLVHVLPPASHLPPLQATKQGQHVYLQLALFKNFFTGELPESFGSVPLTAFLLPGVELVNLGNLTVPAQGNQARYAWDTYGVNRFIYLFLGSFQQPALFVQRGFRGVQEAPEIVPVKVEVYQAPAVAPLALEAHEEETELKPDTGMSLGLSLQLHRTSLTKAYVILILAIPLILEVLLVGFLFRRRREAQQQQQQQPGFETLAGVAAVLFAILPIRLVLVPSGIDELTLVDFILGLEMAVLVAIACVAAGKALERDPQAPPAQQPEDP
jgi:hypothetical protein